MAREVFALDDKEPFIKKESLEAFATSLQALIGTLILVGAAAVVLRIASGKW